MHPSCGLMHGPPKRDRCSDTNINLQDPSQQPNPNSSQYTKRIARLGTSTAQSKESSNNNTKPSSSWPRGAYTFQVGKRLGEAVVALRPSNWRTGAAVADMDAAMAAIVEVGNPITCRVREATKRRQRHTGQRWKTAAVVGETQIGMWIWRRRAHRHSREQPVV